MIEDNHLSIVILPILQVDGDVLAPFTATTYPPERNTHARGLRSPREARARADRVLGRRRLSRSWLCASLREHERVLTDARSLAATYSAWPSAGYAPKVVTRGSAGALTTNTRILLFDVNVKKLHLPDILTHSLLCKKSRNERKMKTRGFPSLAKL